MDKAEIQELQALRERIDGIDCRILELMNQRLGTTVQDTEPEAGYEDRVLRRLQSVNEGPIPENALNALFHEILSITRKAKAKRRIAVLGPPGSNMEAAASHFYGTSGCSRKQIEIVYCSTIEEIFRETETGSTHFTVAPVEDSSAWNITGTLDRLFDTFLPICAEVILPVEHVLMSHVKSVTDLQKIYAHGHTLDQCRQWLNNNCPDTEIVSLGSNADAAQKASDEPDAGAIAGKFAADYHGIPVLEDRIEDQSGKTTRFLVLSKQPAIRTGDDKTSLILASRNKPGALVELLKPFKERGINLTKLESRPTKINLWEYMFFIDFLGHKDDEEIQEVLKVVKEEAGFFKILGSYPQGG